MNSLSTSFINFNGNIIYVTQNNKKIGNMFSKRINENTKSLLNNLVRYKTYNIFIKSHAKSNDTFEIIPAKSLKEALGKQKETTILRIRDLHDIANIVKNAISKYENNYIL